MVRADKGNDLAQVGQGREDLRANDDMGLDVVELVLREWAALVQDRLTNPDLADVMQPPGSADEVDLGVGHPELGRDHRGEVGDPG